jgi:NAD-dependent dihydropyrimidine dehydrogenase PreA subunit
MLESLEGKRGEVRAKPPIPALEGLFGQPTSSTTCSRSRPSRWSSPTAARRMPLSAPAAPAAPRSSSSPATSPAAASSRPTSGSPSQLVDDFGGGTASGRPVKAVQVGGPLGAYLSPDAVRPADGLRGVRRGRGDGRPRRHRRVGRHPGRRRHGALRDGVLRQGVLRQVHPLPRRVVRGVEVIDRVIAAPDDGVRRTQLTLLEDLCTTMTKGSLCAMGGLTPMPVRSASSTSRRTSASRTTPRKERVHDDHRRARPRDPRPRHTPGLGGTERARHHRRHRGHGAAGHVGDARREDRRHRRAEAVRDRLAQGLRLLPPVPRRGRGHAGHARVLHHPVHRRHGGLDPHRAGAAAASRCHGALPLRPPHRLRRLRARQLRDAGARARRRPGRGALRPRRRLAPRRGGRQSNPYFAYDPKACIVCSRCVRACSETQGTFALTVEGAASTRGSPPVAPTSCPRSASPAAPASRRARPTPSPRSR